MNNNPHDIPSSRDALFETTLPPTVALLTLLISALIILTIGVSLNYSLPVFAVIFAAGAIAAIGARTASTGATPETSIGIIILWAGSIAFALTAFSIFYQKQAMSPNELVDHLTVAVAVFLTPYGIVSAWLYNNTQTSAVSVLTRYLVGTASLAVISIGWAFVELLPQNTAEIINLARNVVVTVGVFTTNAAFNIAAASIVYIITLYALRLTIRLFPYSVFTVPYKLPQNDVVVDFVVRAIEYVIAAIVLLTVVVLVMATNTTILPQTTTTVLRFANGFTATSLLSGALSITALSVFISTFLALVRQTTRIEGIDVVEIVSPPATLVLVSIFGALLGEQLVQMFVNQIQFQTITNTPAIHQTLNSLPLYTVALLLTTMVLIAAGVVLTIPTVIVARAIADPPLVGFGAAVVSLGSLVTLTIFNLQHEFVIIPIVLGTLLVWSIGEHAITITTELAGGRSKRARITKHNRATQIHTIAVVGVLITAAGVAWGVMTLTPTLPPSTIPYRNISVVSAGIMVVGLVVYRR